MILGAVFCLSLSTLGYELLLTRYFSLAHGNALSFLVISIAMFGFAAGGTFTSLAGRRWTDAAGTAGRAVFPALSLLCALSTVGSFLLVKRIPLDYLRFPVDRLQALYLVASYLLLALPFFFCGLASCTAYSIGSARSGAVAFSSLLGAGAGALLPLLALPVLGEGACVAAAAAVPLIPPLIARRSPLPVRGVSAALLCCLAALAAWQGNGLLAVDPSPYKTLPQLLQAPGTVVTSRSTGILGRVEEVEGPSVRFLPGLSLGYTGPLPAQSAIVVDGDALNIVYALGDAAGSAAFARATHSFAAYVLAGAPGSSLVLQNDGGLALACAAASGGGDITLVVRNPEVARLLRKAYRLSGLAVEADDPRAFVARAGRTWDVIAVEGWGAALPGMASLTEDASLTVDAFRALWRRTADSGVITVSRRLLLPPSDSVRIFGSALGALREEGVRDPETRLAVIRGWGTCTLLVSKAAIGGSARERLVTFAGSMGFDLDYYSGIALEDTNRFNRFDRSYFAEAYLGILGDPGFLAEYPLDVAPQGDGRPFPGRFLRWGRVRDFYRLTGERAYTLFLSGEVIAAAALGEAALACILLLVLPVLARAGRPRGPGTARCLLYFAAARLGFLLDRFLFFFEHLIVRHRLD